MRVVSLLLTLTVAVLIGAVPSSLVPAPSVQAAFPGENGSIAFGTPDARVGTINADGGAFQVLSPSAPISPVKPKWSSDGEKLLFHMVVSQSADNWDVFSMNADGSELTNLTNSARREFVPSWSPDGEQIVFMTDGGSGGQELWLMGANGENPHKLTTEAKLSAFGAPSWSPDGTKIATEMLSDVTIDIFLVDAVTGGFQNLTNTSSGSDREVQPQWSPDGQKIAFTRNIPSSEIWVMNRDGSGRHSVVTSNNPSSPAWSPDGTKLLYADSDGLWITNADGSGAPSLIPNTESLHTPDWQPLGGQCEGTASASSTSTDDDTDGDNIPDNIENNVTHTDPDCADTDGDGLLDPWEVEESVEGAGFDLDDDGDVEVTRDEVFGPYPGECGSESTGPRREPLGQNCGLNFRPDPLHKDVYVEIDWQDCFVDDCPEPTGINGQSLNLPLDPSHHAPNMAGLLDVVNMFRNAPVDNPDDTHGVNLNILVDEGIAHTHNCDQGTSAARAENFGTEDQRDDVDSARILEARELVYRYAWSGHSSIKDYTPPPNEACPLPAFWEIIASGAGAHPLPEYDISPHGYAAAGGRDILVSLAITWICQLYTWDGAPNANHTAPCFRQTIRQPVFIPGLFPARIAQSTGGSVAVDKPVHMMLGLQPSKGVQQIWGRSFANLLGSSLGVASGGIGNDPNTSGSAPVESYDSWSGVSYAPPAVGGSAVPQGVGDAFVPIMPDFSLADADADGDGIPEGVDNCPGVGNPAQADLDSDGWGDDCDLDRDGDGTDDAADGHPADTDDDGADNDADPDDDGDGVADGADNCPLTANPGQENADADAAGDACDYDSDGDGLPDVMEQIMGSDPLSEDLGPEFVGYEETCGDGLDNDGDGDTDGADDGCQDPDGDTVPTSLDNCPGVVSINVSDTNGDGEGDRCEPEGTERTWGDVNCSGGQPSIGDTISLARNSIGLDPGLADGCPEIGTLVEVDGEQIAWGNVDCSAGNPGIGDAIVVGRFTIGLPGNAAGCPALGTTVLVKE